jgi:hypothetical protein
MRLRAVNYLMKISSLGIWKESQRLQGRVSSLRYFPATSEISLRSTGLDVAYCVWSTRAVEEVLRHILTADSTFYGTRGFYPMSTKARC